MAIHRFESGMVSRASLMLCLLVMGIFGCVLTGDAAPRLIIAGDSSTADYDPSKMPHRSWARQLEKYMKPGYVIDTHAWGGSSTKSFIVSGRWAKTVEAVKPGDYVLIQFGGNDQKWHTPFYLEKRFADH